MSGSVLSELRAGRLAGVRRLDLSCGLTEFPPEIFDLADSLEVLSLSGNALRSLPRDLPRLRRLRVLFCSDNPFTELPEVLGQCPALDTIGFKANQIERVPPASLPAGLRWLILSDNRIESLPASLGACTRLQKLALAGNRLQELPPEMAHCTRLELLRLSANRFHALPDWLWQLPRLTWLAFAGNPLGEGLEAAAGGGAMADIDWRDLRLQEVLGSGASGVIHRAEWSPVGQAPRAVAVKLFKSELTSDGLPRSEMAACLGAGEHPHLIGTLGRISGHPQHSAGLVMHLVPPSFKALAGPPSLASCTRDVYADDTRFGLATALRLAAGVAGAARHLHARGIGHGDLYAHNILWNEAGEALLGDFGAASFTSGHAEGLALQRLEIRAFACLLEELLQRCNEARALPALHELQRRCAQASVAARPVFDEVVDSLQRLWLSHAA